MSLPKDPRQLMINMMYLVLTALLALNVSAEIINAFFLVDKGISKSNEVVNLTNSSMFKSLEKQAQAYPNFRPLKETALQANSIITTFVEQVSALREELIESSGGYDLEGKDPTLPKRKKDKDVTTRMLVKEGRGDSLQQQIITTRQQLLDLIKKPEDREKVAANIPLNISPIPEGKENLSWSQYNFQQMPIAAVLPMLSKFENDARISETTILNHLVGATTQNIIMDEFEPVVSAKKGYIIKGDEYESEVFLSARSSQVKNMKIMIDGQSYPVNDGKVRFKRRADRLGPNSYKVDIVLRNPLTNKSETYSQTFQYEVGERSMTVSATKMNVFYIGVDNPVEVSAAGSNSTNVKVSITGGGASIRKLSNNQYVVTAQKPTKNCELTVTADGISQTKTFRVKRVPDPIVKLGKKTGGAMSVGEFKAHEALLPDMGNFDFDIRCEILGFELARVPARKSPMVERNGGKRYKGKALKVRNSVERGDTYYFSDVKVKCPGDEYPREVNSLAFKIR